MPSSAATPRPSTSARSGPGTSTKSPRSSPAAPPAQRRSPARQRRASSAGNGSPSSRHDLGAANFGEFCRPLRRRTPKFGRSARAPTLPQPCQGSLRWAAMRDFLAATRERVIVYDGGMGATLEQFDLSLEDDYKLPGRCHEALVLNRPDVIEGVHTSMLDAGAQVLETDTFQASRIKLEEWGLADYTVEINTKAAEIARKAAGSSRFVAGSIGPTGYLPASEDPTLGQIRFGELVEVFTEQASGLLAGGVDLLIIETAQALLEVKAAIFGARAAFTAAGRQVPIHTSVSLLPNGGKLLLG